MRKYTLLLSSIILGIGMLFVNSNADPIGKKTVKEIKSSGVNEILLNIKNIGDISWYTFNGNEYMKLFWSSGAVYATRYTCYFSLSDEGLRCVSAIPGGATLVTDEGERIERFIGNGIDVSGYSIKRKNNSYIIWPVWDLGSFPDTIHLVDNNQLTIIQLPINIHPDCLVHYNSFTDTIFFTAYHRNLKNDAAWGFYSVNIRELKVEEILSFTDQSGALSMFCYSNKSYIYFINYPNGILYRRKL